MPILSFNHYNQLSSRLQSSPKKSGHRPITFRGPDPAKQVEARYAAQLSRATAAEKAAKEFEHKLAAFDLTVPDIVLWAYQNAVNNHRYEFAPSNYMPAASAAYLANQLAARGFASWVSSYGRFELTDKGKALGNLTASEKKFEDISGRISKFIVAEWFPHRKAALDKHYGIWPWRVTGREVLEKLVEYEALHNQYLQAESDTMEISNWNTPGEQQLKNRGFYTLYREIFLKDHGWNGRIMREVVKNALWDLQVVRFVSVGECYYTREKWKDRTKLELSQAAREWFKN